MSVRAAKEGDIRLRWKRDAIKGAYKATDIDVARYAYEGLRSASRASKLTVA